jgi:hypothetical protein
MPGIDQVVAIESNGATGCNGSVFVGQAAADTYFEK